MWKRGKELEGEIATSEQRRTGKRKHCIGEIQRGSGQLSKHTRTHSDFTPRWAFRQLSVNILSYQNKSSPQAVDYIMLSALKLIKTDWSGLRLL